MSRTRLGLVPLFKNDDGSYEFDRKQIRRVGSEDVDGEEIDGEVGDDDTIDGIDDAGVDVGALSHEEREEYRRRKHAAKGGGKAARKALAAWKKRQAHDGNDSVEPTHHPKKVHTMNQSTVLSKKGTNGGGAAAEVTIELRPQEDFKARNIRVVGTAGSTIDSIRFGNTPIWDEADGVPVELFSATATELDLLANRSIRGGLDIKVRATIPAGGYVHVTIPGEYTSGSRC